MSRPIATANTVRVHVPFAIRKYGGRKQVITPVGASPDVERRRTDNTLVKALARAFRWKKLLESGRFTTVKELANHENLAFSYMSRVLRLSLLAPEIIEAILDGRQPPEMTLADLLEPFPVEWEEQTKHFFCFKFPIEGAGTATLHLVAHSRATRQTSVAKHFVKRDRNSQC